MSTHIAEVVQYSLTKHPNADTLSIATVKGWECIVKTSDFDNNISGLGVYIPSDMVADKDHPLLGFLEGKRIKPVRLRKIFSQGILLPLDKVVETYLFKKFPKIGDDLTSVLQVRRWEAPAELRGQLKTTSKSPEVSRPAFFDKYTDIENWNNYPDIIEEDEDVIVTEKIDGSCSSFAIIDGKFYISSRNRVLRTEPVIIYTPRLKHSKYRKFNKFLTRFNLLRFFGRKEILPVDDTIWHKVAVKFELEKKLTAISKTLGEKNIVIYGEVVPTQVRAGKIFDYGYSKDDVGFIAFDLRTGTSGVTYLSQIETKKICEEYGIPFSPVLYTGKFTKDVLSLRTGNSTLNGSHLREGIVIQPLTPRYHSKLGRVILKKKNEDFLLIE